MTAKEGGGELLGGGGVKSIAEIYTLGSYCSLDRPNKTDLENFTQFANFSNQSKGEIARRMELIPIPLCRECGLLASDGLQSKLQRRQQAIWTLWEFGQAYKAGALENGHEHRELLDVHAMP